MPALTIVRSVLTLRFAWIFGLISTSDYAKRSMDSRPASDSAAIAVPGSRFTHLESALLQDRIAVVLFLLGTLILTYTLLYSPAFA